MKKIFTLRSVFATIILCCCTLTFAQTNTEQPFIECGQTGSSYMPQFSYVGQAEFAEFWIRGKNLQSDITFRGYSDKDTEAIFTFDPEVVSKTEAEAGTEMNSKVFRVYITPAAAIAGAKYFLEVITEGYTAQPIEIIFPTVLDTVPHFTFSVENPYDDAIYVGKEYQSTLWVKGNQFVNDSVYLLIPDNSDIISITPNVLSKDTVLTTWGGEVKVRFKPSKASGGDNYNRTSFPLIVRTKGMADQICNSVACHITANAPAVEITASMYGQSVYIGETIQKTIWVKGNPYLQGDITLKKVNADDDMTFDPAVISKTNAQTDDGAAVVVTITPKVSSNGEMARFYFTASTPGAEDTEAFIRVWEVKDRIPEVTLQVPSYIATNGMVGKNYQIPIQVVANQYTTSEITLYSENEDVRLFTPSTIPAEAAKAGAEVIVYIRPSEASPTDYTRQTFIIKAHTEGANEDAEAAIQFVVDANDGTGTDKDPDIISKITDNTENGNIWTTSNDICIQLNEDAHVKIYNIAGQCIADTKAKAGTTYFTLTKGIYIVQLNNKNTKVSIK